MPPVDPQASEESYHFIYKDHEYDCTQYAKKHPGGEIFFARMKEEKKDFTEYFRMLHSKRALKILKAQPATQVGPESEGSKQYTQIKRKVKPLMEPIWEVEVIITTMLGVAFYLGVTDTCWWRAIPTLCLVQILSGWIAHSQNHSRNFYLWKFSTALGVVNGLSTKWWQYKHNNHHAFTNRVGKDDDINHNYAQWQYCFLFIKWKIDSLQQAISTKQGVFLIIHWIIMYQQQLWITIIAMVIGGWFTANILIGNHEREEIFFDKIDKPFLKHQIAATRNYGWTGTNIFSIILMGGMQYQTEHHMFPQIPFYRLPKASTIIRQELAKLGLKIKVDKIF